MIIVLLSLLFYPALVLCIAIAGPHHPVEQAELQRRKASDRRRASQEDGR